MGVLALLLRSPQGASFVYFCLEMGFTIPPFSLPKRVAY